MEVYWVVYQDRYKGPGNLPMLDATYINMGAGLFPSKSELVKAIENRIGGFQNLEWVFIV